MPMFQTGIWNLDLVLDWLDISLKSRILVRLSNIELFKTKYFEVLESLKTPKESEPSYWDTKWNIEGEENYLN